MATENPRVWFKSLSLENVRSFGKRQTIYFTDNGREDGKAAQWNVILGDNGTGKTTVLKGLCIATNNYWGEGDAISMIRSQYNNTASLRFVLAKNDISYPEVGNWIEVEGRRHGLQVRSHNHSIAGSDGVRELEIFAYGASRRPSATSQISSSEKGYTVKSLFEEGFPLLNVSQWFIQAKLASLESGKEGLNYFNLVKKILEKLFKEEVSAIDTSQQYYSSKVFFTTYYGKVEFEELSLGYRTLVVWMVDFAKGLFDRYPTSSDPFSEPAVCLVDEIDLHLHPKFQRNIIKFLTETFPNTQFIVTAHSPLIVQSAEDYNANLILLKREGNETVVINEPIDVRNWRLDQILSSELFGIEDKNTQLRRERDHLLAIVEPKEAERTRIDELNRELDAVPFSNDPAEMKAESIIYHLAEALRSKM